MIPPGAIYGRFGGGPGGAERFGSGGLARKTQAVTLAEITGVADLGAVGLSARARVYLPSAKLACNIAVGYLGAGGQLTPDGTCTWTLAPQVYDPELGAWLTGLAAVDAAALPDMYELDTVADAALVIATLAAQETRGLWRLIATWEFEDSAAYGSAEVESVLGACRIELLTSPTLRGVPLDQA